MTMDDNFVIVEKEDAGLQGSVFPGLSSYSTEACSRIQERRQELQGHLFFDDLLSSVVEGYTKDAYPPQPNVENSLGTICQLISDSTLDRIKKAALLYYIALDIDHQDSEHSTAQSVIQTSGLPSNVVNIISGYWNLDRGNYTLAASLLADVDENLVQRILQVLSPLPYTAISETEAQNRAKALSTFLQFAKVQGQPILSPSEEDTVVTLCWNQGIWSAWKQCRLLPTSDAKWDFCVGRILEHCLMPEPKATAIKELIALPLSTEEEAVLAHAAVNPPPNVTLSLAAHSMAVDILLIRYINSGKHLEAVMLDRRVQNTIELVGKASENRDENERERFRRLKTKREALIRGAFSVLTKMDRTYLDLGDYTAIGESDKDQDLEKSWEKVKEGEEEDMSAVAEQSTMDDSSTTQATHTPIRMRAIDPVISAIATASPLRRESLGASPRSSAGRKDSLNRSGSGLESPRGSPSVHQKPTVLSAARQSPHLSSPLVKQKPYAPDSNASHKQNEPTSSSISANNEGESGPYSRLAQQLLEEMAKNDQSIDTILQPSMSASPFKVSGDKKNAHSTLVLKRPDHRYEARYEIGDKSTSKTSTDRADMALDEEQVETPSLRNPRRRRTGQNYLDVAAAAANKSRSIQRRQRSVPIEEDGDTSVPGSFPGHEAVPEPQVQPKRSSRRKKSNQIPVHEEENDAVPELVSPTSSKPKSRSTKKAPLRRSTRLSVEPEAEIPTNETPANTRSSRHLQRSSSPTKPARSRRTRATSQAPVEDVDDDEDPPLPGGGMMTRSGSRRRL